MSGVWTSIKVSGGFDHPRIERKAFSIGTEPVVIGNGQSAMLGGRFGNRANASAFSRISWRDLYVAVSNGRDVLVWGGISDRGQLDDGGVFSPAEGRWRGMAPAPLAGRSSASGVWAENEMILIGGATDAGAFFSDGAAYDPDQDSWRPVSAFPLQPRFAANTIWTGREMVVWGGVVASGFADDGAAYDPAADSWRPISPAPIGGRMDGTTLWTGTDMVVWGGTQRSAGNQLNDGASYDPVADAWKRIPESPLRGRWGHTAVWTGKKMVIWGGAEDIGGDAPPPVLGDGASFEPSSGTWELLPRSPLGPRYRHAATWTGQEMILSGGCCQGFEGSAFADGASYRPG